MATIRLDIELEVNEGEFSAYIMDNNGGSGIEVDPTNSIDDFSAQMASYIAGYAENLLNGDENEDE